MTLPQQNQALSAWNSAMLSQQYGGGPAGAGSEWTAYNDLLQKYGGSNPASVTNYGSGVGAGGSSSGSGYGGGIGSYGTSSGTTGSPSSFNLNPSPQAGSGTFGAVPGAIGAPPSIWQQTNAAVPQVGALATQDASLIGSQLSGQLSPTTISSLTNSAASRGVTVGQPNGSLVNESLLSTMGLTQEQLENQGQGNYLSFLNAVGNQQNSPSLLADIASRNATMAAAPNPTDASLYMESLAQGHPGIGGAGYNALTGTSGNNALNTTNQSGIDNQLLQALYGLNSSPVGGTDGSSDWAPPMPTNANGYDLPAPSNYGTGETESQWENYVGEEDANNANMSNLYGDSNPFD